jgi:maltokinase
VTPDPDVFVAYLDRTRWFGGKGRPYAVTDVLSLGVLPGGPPLVVIQLVEVTYSDAEGGTELYQVPLAFYEHPEHRLDHAFLGWWQDATHGWVHAYDALHDRDAMALWQRAFDDAAETPAAEAGPLVFHRLPGYELDLEAHSTLFAGEQSNSSVAYGEDALMKVFRKITPGVNPDIEILEALTRAESPNVAALYGWLDADDPRGSNGEPVQLAMLQQFLRTATDGWDLALASVRSLYADAEVQADESGGDFAGEATRLGEALREVHDALRVHFPTGSGTTAGLAAAMTARLDAAVAAVPDLAGYADGLQELFGEVAGLGTLDVQRIHGDLHLGQTLRTSVGWKIVDFEGEPAKPLAERRLPDSPWRDVAGMLRSFDYAPRVVERSLGTADEADAARIDSRAAEWAERNKTHFLLAYADGELSDPERTLLSAYVADKAVYETVYETRNRPSWVPIPLQAVARIGAA